MRLINVEHQACLLLAASMNPTDSFQFLARNLYHGYCNQFTS
uniref:Uncharacterized protein n=1 Tax=Arundo donax TaxID=35708 RepID=A0A0A9BU41_ARUDO